jgi:hypothetical protein
MVPGTVESSHLHPQVGGREKWGGEEERVGEGDREGQRERDRETETKTDWEWQECFETSKPASSDIPLPNEPTLSSFPNSFTN